MVRFLAPSPFRHLPGLKKVLVQLYFFQSPIGTFEQLKAALPEAAFSYAKSNHFLLILKVILKIAESR